MSGFFKKVYLDIFLMGDFFKKVYFNGGFF